MHYYSISQSDTEWMSVGQSYKGRLFGLTKSKHKCLILSSICNIWWKTAVFHSIIKIYFNRQWLFKAIKKEQVDSVHILLANPPSCEMLLYTLWKDGGRHMEIHRQSTYAKQACVAQGYEWYLRLRSHLTVEMRAQMTKGICTLTSDRNPESNSIFLCISYLLLQACEETLRSETNSVTAKKKWVPKNYCKYVADC